MISSLKADNFGILNISTHEFSSQGFSVCVLLSESHATIHTCPEYNSLVFYMYSCRGKNDCKKTFEILVEKLKPKNFEFFERNVVVEKS